MRVYGSRGVGWIIISPSRSLLPYPPPFVFTRLKVHRRKGASCFSHHPQTGTLPRRSWPSGAVLYRAHAGACLSPFSLLQEMSTQSRSRRVRSDTNRTRVWKSFECRTDRIETSWSKSESVYLYVGWLFPLPGAYNMQFVCTLLKEKLEEGKTETLVKIPLDTPKLALKFLFT